MRQITNMTCYFPYLVIVTRSPTADFSRYFLYTCCIYSLARRF
jgi:hypothetical protein